MHIVVVEALLVSIYLTEKKDVYILIQPTSLPEATSFSYLCLAEPTTSWRVATETWPICNNFRSASISFSFAHCEFVIFYLLFVSPLILFPQEQSLLCSTLWGHPGGFL